MNRDRARRRYSIAKGQPAYKEQHKINVSVARANKYDDLPRAMKVKIQKLTGSRRKASANNVTRYLPTKQQQYWLRRTRLLKAAAQRKTMLALQQKMSLQSRVFLLDVKLMFNKADNRMRRGLARATKLHTSLAHRASDCLQFIPSDSPTAEDHIVSAFGGVRLHTSSGEPYYWEQAYHSLSTTTLSSKPIAIDSVGRARLFTSVEPTRQPVSYSTAERLAKVLSRTGSAIPSCVALVRTQ